MVDATEGAIGMPVDQSKDNPIAEVSYVEKEFSYILRDLRGGNRDLAELLRSCLEGLLKRSWRLTQDQRDSLVAVIDQEFMEGEEDRKADFLYGVANGEIPADAESKLSALIESIGDDRTESPFPDGSMYLGPLAQHIVDIKALPYEEFLKTDYWKTVRSVVVLRAKGRCQVCNRPGAIHTHHRSYQHHGEEHLHLEDLIALCAACHKTFHDNGRLSK